MAFQTCKILTFFWLLLSMKGVAQDRVVDSLQNRLETGKVDTNRVKDLNRLALELNLKYDYEQASGYAEEALLLSKQLDFELGKAAAYYNIAYGFSGTSGDFQVAKIYLDSALTIFKKWDQHTSIADCYLRFGVSYFTIKSDYGASQENVLRALAIYEKKSHKKGVAKCYELLGLISSTIGDTLRAIQYTNDALNMFQEMGDSSEVAYLHNLIGGIFEDRSNDSIALARHFAALQIYTQLGKRGPPFGVPYSYGLIGEIYLNQGLAAFQNGDKVLAKRKLIEALRFIDLRAKGETGSMSHRQSYDQLAKCYLALSRLSDRDSNLSWAKLYAKKVLQIGIDTDFKGSIYSGYLLLSEIAKEEGDYKLAYDYYINYTTYQDSIFNDEMEGRILQSKLQYEFDKQQDSTRAVQDKRDALAGAEIAYQKVIRNFSIALGCLILAFSVYGFYRYKKKREMHNQQALMKERLRISRELHDELGATLSGISMYSHLTKEQIRNNQTADVERSLNVIQQSAGEMVNELNDIVWLINPDQDSVHQLSLRLEEYARDMAAVKNMQVDVRVQEHLRPRGLPVEFRRNIYLFCKEAINNAVKYSGASLLTLEIKAVGNIFHFSVIDNGKGFDVAQIKRGNGLGNMEKRAVDIRARFTLQSRKDEGTQLSMEVMLG